MAKKLSDRKRKFAREYVVDLNATQAAIRAGYSARTANRLATRLLSDDGIRSLLAQHAKRALAKTELAAGEVVERLSWIGDSDPADFFETGGQLRSIHELPERARKAISSIEVVRRNLESGDGEMEYVYKIKWWDKNKALDLLAKYHKLVSDQPDVNVSGQNVQIVVQFPDHKNNCAIPAQARVPVSAASL